MIRYCLLSKQHTWTQIDTPQPNAWIYISNPSEEELTELTNSFHLEYGHLKDALDVNEVPRFEEEDNCAYLYTRIPIAQNNLFTTLPILFILHPTAVFSVSKTKLDILENFYAKNNISYTNLTELFILFFNEIITHYNNAISKIDKQTISTTINIDRIENRDIVTLVLYEQVLNEFLNAVVQTNAFLKVFISNKRFIKKKSDYDRIEDLFLATGQLIELSKSSLSQVKNIREAYSAIMTNNLNRVIKFFTALTIVFTIPMIIASLYGMNVTLPFQNHPYAFIGVLMVILFLSFGVFYIFFRRRWL